jgi:hypothetical protein
MRTFRLALLVAACAAKHPPAENPPSALDGIQLRACDSCRQGLDLCRRQRNGDQDPGGKAQCMDQFTLCLQQQQLDTRLCAGPE